MHIQTVTGPVSLDMLGMIDGHAHAWIDPPENAPTRLELNDERAIADELRAFREAGGSALVDCQPGGCGRDANRLRTISAASGVYITATSGFHQQMYYPPDHWLWSSDVETAAAYFRREVGDGMDETGIPATTLKVGYEGVTGGQTGCLMQAVAQVAAETGTLVLFHTERGANVEALLPFFDASGVPPSQLYLCHVDKRPDFGLHRELAQAGVMLGYDTFVRPKYDPDQGVWVLLRQMVDAGYAGQIAICQDRALSSMWRYRGDPQGMTELALSIRSRLEGEGFDDETCKQLLGGNIARYLVRRA